MGFASNRGKARQFVTHGHFTVNGRKLGIPSAMVKIGDVVSVKQNSRAMPYFKDLSEDMASRDVASWVEVDPKNMSGKLVRLPGAQEAQPILNEQLIVEHYSRRI
jgi:small subunit ribosomal protein S4